ncbi:hypothetical protein [Natrialba taiwanensis]|uniref:Uncharacterized protein n=1 Tax=Natrialba taiwanensis DSM 12281 TaxID=1230458 RepID=L9ZKZ9_9EURY|nr:hypothetical protein [Natrialba taiwanensis]ELY87205.1 hypothetical protein C484_17631 [Natrialba taiwanensis DSM 12281]
MKGPGLFDMLQLAAGFSMAGPMFVVGFEFIRTDRIIGGGIFLVLGVLTLYLPTYVINRIGGPRAWIRRRFERRRWLGGGGGESGGDGDGNRNTGSTGRDDGSSSDNRAGGREQTTESGGSGRLERLFGR